MLSKGEAKSRRRRSTRDGDAASHPGKHQREEVEPPVTEPTPPRPRRSVLYRLGVEEHAYEKANTLHPDVLLFEIEDSVPPGDKDRARARVVATLKAGGFKRQEKLPELHFFNAVKEFFGKDDHPRFWELGQWNGMHLVFGDQVYQVLLNGIRFKIDILDAHIFTKPHQRIKINAVARPVFAKRNHLVRSHKLPLGQNV